MNIGAASECMNEWADEDAGIEAVQRIADTLDDIAALQDPEVDPDVLISMLRDTKLHELLKVITNNLNYISPDFFDAQFAFVFAFAAV